MSRSSERCGATSTTRRPTSSTSTSATSGASSAAPRARADLHGPLCRLSPRRCAELRRHARDRADSALRRRLPGGLRWRLTAWVAVVMLLFAGDLRGRLPRDRRPSCAIRSTASWRATRASSPTTCSSSGGARPARWRRRRAATSTTSRSAPARRCCSRSSPARAPAPTSRSCSARRRPTTARAPPSRTRRTVCSPAVHASPTATPPCACPTSAICACSSDRVTIAAWRPGVTIGVGEPLATVRRAQRWRRARLHPRRRARARRRAAGLLPDRRPRLAAAAAHGGDRRPRRRGRARPAHPRGGRPRRRGAGARRRLQPHARPALRRVRGPARVRRRRVARAAHAADRDPRPARSARRPARPPIEEVRRVERLVQAEVSRITRLVDDLLLLAKSEETQFLHVEPIDLRPYIEDLWDGMSLTAERRFELAPFPAGTLRADPDRLAQALRNLPATRSSTPPPDGLVRLDVDRVAAATACASLWRTTAPAFPPISASGSSTASTAPTQPATAPPAAPASGWRSSARSPRRTGGGHCRERGGWRARSTSSSWVLALEPIRRERARPSLRRARSDPARRVGAAGAVVDGRRRRCSMVSTRRSGRSRCRRERAGAPASLRADRTLWTIAPAIDPLSPNNFELARPLARSPPGWLAGVDWQRRSSACCPACHARESARRLGLSAFARVPLTEPNDRAGSAAAHA